jgi:hypothetical protein
VISHARMAERITNRIRDDVREIRWLRDKLRLEVAQNVKMRRELRKAASRCRVSFRVPGVEVGDGKPSVVTVELVAGAPGSLPLFVIRRYRCRTVWTLPMHEAAGILARRAQVRMAEMRTGGKRGH